MKIKCYVAIFIMRTAIFCFLLMAIFNQARAEEIYVYKDKSAPQNIFNSVAVSGDNQGLKIKNNFDEIFKKGTTSIKISYVPHADDKNGWVRILWQKPDGYNLIGAKKLSFFARGERGDEVVEFGLGSLSASRLDSDSAALAPVLLTKDWQKYKISLFGLDLSKITNGFSCVINRFDNRRGAIFYLDEIRFEK